MTPKKSTPSKAVEKAPLKVPSTRADKQPGKALALRAAAPMKTTYGTSDNTLSITVTHTDPNFAGTITVLGSVVLGFTNGTASASVPASALSAIDDLGFQVSISGGPSAPGYDANLDALVKPIVSNTASTTNAALKAAFVAVTTPEAQGAKGDGTTDDTAAVNAAIAAVQTAGGGTVLLNPTKTYRCNGALVFTTTGTSSAPVQKPVRITTMGGAGGWNGYWASSPLNGGGVLDLRYDGTDSQHPAKIDTRGAGLLEIDHITLMSGGSDDFPFLQTTNTTVHAHHNSVIGNSAKSGTSCVQDVFLLGSTTTTIGNTATAPFQGYGTKISENYYSHVRRGVYGQVYANAVVVRDNTFSTTCGNSSGGAILFDGDPTGSTGNQNSGCLIEGNLIESTNYQYGIVIRRCNRMQVIANSCYDSTATTLAAVLFDTAQWNLLIVGFNTPGLVALAESGNAVGTTTVLTSEQSAAQRFPGPVHGYGTIRGITSGTDAADIRSLTGGGDQAVLWATPGSNPYPEVGLVSIASSQVTDGATTSGSTTVTSATANWTASHIGLPIKGAGIPTGSRIQTVKDSHTVTITQAATATATGVTLNYFSTTNASNQEIGFSRRHIRSKGAIGTATPNANAGTGATASASGTDMAWTLTLTTGTSPAAGAQASVAAGINWSNPAKLALTPKNAAAAGQAGNVYLTDTISATVLNAVAPLAASTQYVWDIVGFE